MRKVTSDFKTQIEKDNRNYYEWVDITLKNGTILKLTNKDIWNYGIKIEDAVSDTSEFQVGTAIINKATVTLNNIYDDFTEYDFDEAKIVIYIGYNIEKTILYRSLQDTEGKKILDSTGNEIVTLVDGSLVEKVKMFTGTVTESPYQNSSIITLTCEDNMMKFDRDYSESKLEYPATRAQIFRDACEICGVQLETLEFKYDDYVIQTRPDDENLTFRQVIAWNAQIGGQWCRCNSDGKLCCRWYDLENYEADNVEEDNFDLLYSNDSVTVNSEDVIITGIKVTAYEEDQNEEKPEISLYGKEGYLIEISENRLIERGTAETVSNMIGEQVAGLRFRPFSANTLNNPTYEAGDICIIRDRKGVEYKSFITSSTFQVGNSHSVQCGAKSAVKNSAKRYSLFSQTQIQNRKNFQKEKNEREKAIEELNKTLGNASGMYQTEVVQPDGSTIAYIHDKKELSDSKNVIKITSEAVGLSTDGGTTYPYGLFLTGDLITRILYAVGINADYIKTGAITVKDNSGNIIFQVDMNTKKVRINGNNVEIGSVSAVDAIDKNMEDSKKYTDESVNDFKETIETTFKDGIITEAEAKSIEKYLKEIEKDNASIQKRFDAVAGSVSRQTAPSGKNTSIKFNADCKTEVSASGTKYDYLCLFYKKDEKIYKALNKVSGEEIAGKTYIVPSTEIYIQWYSDSSNCDFYGFSIDELKAVSTTADTEGTESVLPVYEVIEAAAVSMIQTSHPYENNMQKLWHYKARTVTQTTLNRKMTSYKTAYTKLINAINNAISDKKITDTERNNVNTKFDTYNTALADLNEEIEAAGVDVAAIAAAAVAEYARAAIKVEADKIELRVTSAQVESLIEQKVDSIRLKASKISWESTYSSMTENGTLTCQNADVKGTITSESGGNKAMMTSGYSRYYYSGSALGQIGTNQIASDNSKKGLVFDLETSGSYMAWASRDSSSASVYNMKMTYVRKAFSTFSANAVNMGCDLDMQNYTLKNPVFEGGGITKTINYVQVLRMNTDGTVAQWGANGRMGFKNGILIDLNYYTAS